jgi:hypothetical protein
MVHSAQTVHLSCTDANSVSNQTKTIPHDPRYLELPSGASKTISEPMVHLAQPVHLTCVKISTISKQTETSFHFNLVTLEYHRVRPKRLQSVWRKPCNYLALTLTPSPNRPKQDLTWPTSPKGSIRCVQNDFHAYGTFSPNRPPILHQD